ncbi:MAG: gfo/Idh/MocA family oxidoreductase, partial [Actinomycetia bacterium]|nr:gfo/Idh/MocA family oxidoreductase [Actinomycetes bacterium]
LRHHPSWQAFVELAHDLGKPLVMRMNLNQQSDGPEWATHKAIMASTSPLVDCGVHYVDVMAQMTRAKAIRVHAIGTRLASDIAPDMYNYGQLQVTFDDGSIGWYEAGWGPMMSETAFFIKDVIGPNGAASIESGLEESAVGSADVGTHTTTNMIRRHFAEVDDYGRMRRKDELLRSDDEPDHDQLCQREQEWFLAAINGQADITQHLADVVDSMKIVLAADQSIKSGTIVDL